MKLSRRQLRRLLISEANQAINKKIDYHYIKASNRLFSTQQKFTDALSPEEKKEDKYIALMEFMELTNAAVQEIEKKFRDDKKSE